MRVTLNFPPLYLQRHSHLPIYKFAQAALDVRFERSDAAVRRCANERVCPRGPFEALQLLKSAYHNGHTKATAEAAAHWHVKPHASADDADDDLYYLSTAL